MHWHHRTTTLLLRLKTPLQKGTSRLGSKRKWPLSGGKLSEKHKWRNLSTPRQITIKKVFDLSKSALRTSSIQTIFTGHCPLKCQLKKMGRVVTILPTDNWDSRAQTPHQRMQHLGLAIMKSHQIKAAIPKPILWFIKNIGLDKYLRNRSIDRSEETKLVPEWFFCSIQYDGWLWT